MRRLLIRPGGIGDCITCFPVMEWLRSDYTEVWVPSAVVPLVRFAEQVRPIAGTGLDLVGIDDGALRERLVSELQSFDEIISWYGTNRPEFREAVQKINPNSSFLPALPPDGFDGHVTDFHAANMGAPAGLQPAIPVRPAPRNRIVIHPFSGGRRKNWPLERFRKLAEGLTLPVEWTAGPEEELAEATRFGDLMALATWIAGASLYIGNDSGITHLAAAAGVPTLALFGATKAATWGPRGRCVTVLARESLEAISVQEVREAAERLSARRNENGPAAAFSAADPQDRQEPVPGRQQP